MRSGPSETPRSALFLDRDGVIVHDPGYLSHRSDVRLITGAAELIAQANARDIAVVVVTNQSGIARGLFDWQAFEQVNQEIEHQLSLPGASLDAIIACPFHPDFTGDFEVTGKTWRKPAPGMITFAAEQLNIDPGKSFMVGDNITDIGAAKAAGLAGAVLVLTDHGEAHMHEVHRLQSAEFSVGIADNLFDAGGRLREWGLDL